MSNFSAKAVRATIKLGEIVLDVFQLTDGEYRLSQTQTGEAVDKTELSVRQFYKSKSPEALPWLGYTPVKLVVEKDHDGRGETRINGVPIEMAAAYWTKEAVSGNVTAARLLGACAAEAIERRADKAFAVLRSEEERNERFQARQEGKKVRLDMTDAIAWYKEKHKDELSDNTKQWMYKNCSDALNIGLFGRTAKKLCIDLEVNDRSKLRNALTNDELRWISQVEELAARLVVYHGMKPIDSVKESLLRNVIPVVERKAK